MRSQGAASPAPTAAVGQPGAMPPFACQHSPELPELLATLDCSLAISTYQAGRVLIVSSDGDRLHLLPRAFDTPMGIAVQGNRMAVACREETTLLVHDPSMGPTYPSQTGVYDTLYLPRQTLYTGAVALHDIAFGQAGLYAVNTAFSCLCLLDNEYSFKPIWQPRFISALQAEDRCHLNGLALREGLPAYTTALGSADRAQGWRDNLTAGGVVMDVSSGETVLSSLPMPHSPRIVNNDLYLLLSATGQLVRADIEAGGYEVVRNHPGFARGLAVIGDYLIVGLSRLRSNSTFASLPLAQRNDLICGLEFVHLPTGALVSQLKFLQSCSEIFDLCVLSGLRRPGILGTQDTRHRGALSLPESSFWGSRSPTV